MRVSASPIILIQPLPQRQVVLIQVSPQALQSLLRPAAAQVALDAIRSPFSAQKLGNLQNLLPLISLQFPNDETMKKILSAVQALMSKGSYPSLQNSAFLLPFLGYLFGKGENANAIHHLLLIHLANAMGKNQSGKAVTEADLLQHAQDTQGDDALKKTPSPLNPEHLIERLAEFAKGSTQGFTHLSLVPSPFSSLPDFLGKFADLKSLCLNGGTLEHLGEPLSLLGKLEALSAAGNNLSSLSLSSLSNLRVLNLALNQLTALPSSLSSLSALAFLNLQGNQLSSLPSALFGLGNLKTLLLDQNSLTSLSGKIGDLNSLQLLSIAGNPLDRIPSEIAKLPFLETLIISPDQWNKLPAEVLAMKGLNILIQGGENASLPNNIPTRNDSIVVPYPAASNHSTSSRRKKKTDERDKDDSEHEEAEEREEAPTMQM